MCDLSGDIETAGLLLERRVFVSQQGQVSSELQEGYFEVNGVAQCDGCSVQDILPLINLEPDVLSKLSTNENHIAWNSTLMEEVSLLKPRKPGMQLVCEGDQLLGVVVDQCGQVQILGVVSRVVTACHSPQLSNVLVVHASGQLETSNSEKLHLDQMAQENNTRLITTSLGGYLLLQPKPDSPQLTLLLQQTYLVLIDTQLTWIRASATLEIESKRALRETQIKPLEIVVSKQGAVLPSGAPDHHAMNLLGSDNAVLHYPAFRQSIRCLAIRTNSPRATSS